MIKKQLATHIFKLLLSCMLLVHQSMFPHSWQQSIILGWNKLLGLERKEYILLGSAALLFTAATVYWILKKPAPPTSPPLLPSQPQPPDALKAFLRSQLGVTILKAFKEKSEEEALQTINNPNDIIHHLDRLYKEKRWNPIFSDYLVHMVSLLYNDVNSKEYLIQLITLHQYTDHELLPEILCYVLTAEHLSKFHLTHISASLESKLRSKLMTFIKCDAKKASNFQTSVFSQGFFFQEDNILLFFWILEVIYLTWQTSPTKTGFFQLIIESLDLSSSNNTSLELPAGMDPAPIILNTCKALKAKNQSLRKVLEHELTNIKSGRRSFLRDTSKKHAQRILQDFIDYSKPEL